MPGRQRSASIKAFLRDLFSTAHGIVECRRNEIFQHFAVIHRRRIDRDTAHIMRAGHRHLDHPRAGLPLHLDLRQLLLRLPHVFLHLLRLLHQAGNSTFHHAVYLVSGMLKGMNGTS